MDTQLFRMKVFRLMPKFSYILFRGLLRRCPKCGKGRIFNGYLTIKKECPICRESLEGIRTDDAAPWATILVVGHLLAPVIPFAIKYDISTWALTALLVGLALVLALSVLPVIKGVFVGLNWRFNIRDGHHGYDVAKLDQN